MIFRKDINALRTFAVLSVVFYHFKIDFISSGFVGVDVFFVMSGYLMTSIIVEKINNKSFSIVDFYIDRIYRIVPALFFLSLTILIFGLFFLFTPELKQLSKELVASNLFLSNIFYYKNSGYFDTSSELMFLLHTWSLSVEWQFYILFPIILIFLNRFNIPLKYIILILFLSSLMLSIYYTPLNQSYSFYLLQTRAWELLAGSLIHFFPLSRWKKESFIIGAIILGFSILVSYPINQWPGINAVVPILGTFLFLQANSYNKFIDNNLVQFIGKISYSIYLWHWPIVVMYTIYGFEFNIIDISLGVLLSIFLGWISYILVEKTFLRIKKDNKKNKVYLLLLSLIFLITPIVSFYIYKKDGVIINNITESNKSEFVQKYIDLQKNIGSYYMSECDFYQKSSISEVCTKKDNQKELSIFLWGDSHAQALSYGIRDVLNERQVNFYQVGTGGCYPSLDFNPRSGLEKGNCMLSNQFALNKIKELRPNIVVLAQRDFHEEIDWENFAIYLKKLGVKSVILVGPIPQYKQSLPVLIVRDEIFEDKNITYFDKYLNTQIIRTDTFLNNKIHDNYYYFSLINKLCNDKGCQVIIDKKKNDLLLFDYGHLTPNGSLVIGDILKDYLIKNGFVRYLK